MSAAYLGGVLPAAKPKCLDYGCDGKQAFKSGAEAQKVVKIRRKYEAPRHIYRCITCGKWHIGSRQKRL